MIGRDGQRPARSPLLLADTDQLVPPAIVDTCVALVDPAGRGLRVALLASLARGGRP